MHDRFDQLPAVLPEASDEEGSESLSTGVAANRSNCDVGLPDVQVGAQLRFRGLCLARFWKCCSHDAHPWLLAHGPTLADGPRRMSGQAGVIALLRSCKGSRFVGWVRLGAVDDPAVGAALPCPDATS